MIGEIPTGMLTTAEISAVIHRGLTVTLPSGKTGKLAIVDQNGVVVDASDTVAREAFNVSVACYQNFLIGKGHLIVRSGPVPGIGGSNLDVAE